jgi:two-component system chemotaxis response regulator CheB
MINLSLTDLIQMVCLSRSDIVIRVKSETADGIICIKKGQVQHAETNKLQGEGAFLEILRWKDGQFEIQSSDSVRSNSIDKPWEHLLLEAMRQHDEHLDEGETASCELEQGKLQPKSIPLLGAENVTTRVDIGEDPWNEAETIEAFSDVSSQPQSSLQRKIRVLVVDDSTFFARQLSKMIETDENIQVVGTAKNGREAVDFLNINPEVDVITLDIQMPVMQGDTTLKHIMIRHAIPVLIVSALDPNQINKVFEFLQLGALDFVPKPALHEDIQRYGERLRSLVKGAASADIGSFKRCRRSDQESTSHPEAPIGSTDKAFVIVGAEGAHMEWLRLPWKRLCRQGLVVGLQKISKPMLQGFAGLIENFTGMATIPIDDRAKITPGRFYLSDAGRHVEMSLSREPSFCLDIEESLSEPLSWENGCALWIEKLASALGSRLSVCFLSGVHPIGDDCLNTLMSQGSRLILPSVSTIVCREMIKSIKRYSETHSFAYMSGAYENLTEVWR